MIEKIDYNLKRLGRRGLCALSLALLLSIGNVQTLVAQSTLTVVEGSESIEVIRVPANGAEQRVDSQEKGETKSTAKVVSIKTLSLPLPAIVMSVPAKAKQLAKKQPEKLTAPALLDISPSVFAASEDAPPVEFSPEIIPDLAPVELIPTEEYDLVEMVEAPQETIVSQVSDESLASAESLATVSEPVPAPLPEQSGLLVSESMLSAGEPIAAGCCESGGRCNNRQCPYCRTQSGAQTICGVDCSHCKSPCCATWDNLRPIPWSLFGPGEYVGPARAAHVPQYYLRVNDEISVVYMISREKTSQRYKIGVGDRLLVESVVDETLDREVDVQPDGSISLPLVGEVQVAGKSVAEVREELEGLYKTVQRQVQITVSLVVSNVALDDLINAVDRRGGTGGQSQQVKVTPEGTIQLPGLGSVYVQGLTLEELKLEVEARYRANFGTGLSITTLLTQRAPTYVFLGGEVVSPGRYTLEGPTTVMQAIALAGGWNVGANTNQIVVFRRDQNWCLKATKIDLFRPLYGKDPCPVNDIWLRDNDLVIIPKRPILVADDIINLYFTRGAYRVFPINFVHNFSQGSVLTLP